MASAMARVYFRLITESKTRTIEDVNPESLRQEVQAMIDEKEASKKGNTDNK